MVLIAEWLVTLGVRTIRLYLLQWGEDVLLAQLVLLVEDFDLHALESLHVLGLLPIEDPIVKIHLEADHLFWP
jgi:hypothetical protein